MRNILSCVQKKRKYPTLISAVSQARMCSAQHQWCLVKTISSKWFLSFDFSLCGVLFTFRQIWDFSGLYDIIVSLQTLSNLNYQCYRYYVRLYSTIYATNYVKNNRQNSQHRVTLSVWLWRDRKQHKIKIITPYAFNFFKFPSSNINANIHAIRN